MNPIRRFLSVSALVAVLAVGAGCSDRDPAELPVARGFDREGLVYGDGEGYGTSVYYQGFSNTHFGAVTEDSVYAYEGDAYEGDRSLKVEVPPLGSALGAYAGGVLTSPGPRDLADYTALTFYARTDQGSVESPTVLLNEVGFGNDNTGASLYDVTRTSIPLTPEWAFHVVPIPDPAKLLSERGLFLFAEGAQPEYPRGYNLWFDEIRFVDLGGIEVFRPMMDTVSRQYFLGAKVPVSGTRTIFRVNGAFMPVGHGPAYYDYVSSEPTVAVVEKGAVRIVAPGQATITATLQGVDVAGRLTVTGYAPPTEPAPRPTLPAGRVISMFSDVYADVPVDTWNTGWGGSSAQLADYAVAGDATKMYSALNFVGIEFLNPVIDASAMTHFHLDVLAPAGTNFRVKFIAFPPDLSGAVETNDLELTADTAPAFVAGGWSSLDIPLSDFALPPDWDWGHVGQMAFSTSDAQLVLVDNVYWHD